MTVGSCVRALGLMAALGVGFVPQPDGVRAGALTDTAAVIEALIAQGRADDAVAAARDFVRAVTDITGFGVANAQLIMGPATGFGVYDPRDSNVFALDEAVYAYVEVYGYTLTPQSNGANRLLFDVSFTLDSPDGRQMTDAMIPMGDVQLESFSAPIDGYFHLTYRVTGAVGAFVLRTHVTDRESGQSAEFTLPVTFEDPAAALLPQDK